MKKGIGLLALAAMAMGGGLPGPNFGSPDPPVGPPMPDITNDENIQKARGMTFFPYRHGGGVWAVNRKNAERKAKKEKRNLM